MSDGPENSGRWWKRVLLFNMSTFRQVLVPGIFRGNFSIYLKYIFDTLWDIVAHSNNLT